MKRADVVSAASVPLHHTHTRTHTEKGPSITEVVDAAEND